MNISPMMNRAVTDPLLCIISGLLLCLCFPPWNFGFIVVIALLPILFTLKANQFNRNTIYAFIMGFSFHLPLLYWLGHVTVPGMFTLVLYVSICLSIPFIVFTKITQLWLRPIVFGVVWASIEYLRTLGYFSFAWGFLGHSLYSMEILLPIILYTGIPVLSGVIACINALLYEYLLVVCRNQSKKRKILVFSAVNFLVLMPFILVWIFSQNADPSAHSLSNSNTQTLKIALLQGNFGMEVKNQHDTRKSIDVYLDLASQAMSDKPELIILPESSISFPLNHSGDIVRRIIGFVDEHDVEMLVGAVHGEKGGNSNWKFWNRAYLFSPGQKWDTFGRPIDFATMQTYDKMHLVPYGEWIPGGDLPIFGWIETLIEEAGAGIFQRGTNQTIFELRNGMKFAVAICFESTLSSNMRIAKRNGADFIVTMTNDAWFKRSPGLEQHFLHSVFRAIENNCYLLRVANTGITAVITPNGRVQRNIPDNKAGYLIDEIVVP